MKSLVFFITILTFTFNTWSQSYSADRGKFIKEFQSALATYGKGEYTDFAKNELAPALLESTDFPEKYFTTMVATCNALVAKRLDTYPDVYNYVFSVYSFVKGKQPDVSYQAWQSTIDKLLESRNPKKFTDFAEMSAGFFSDRRLTAKTNFEWYYEGGEYEFKYDDKPYISLKNGNLICRAIEVAGTTKKDSKFSDSLVVYKTSGDYDPILKKWVGIGGKITWEKVGLDKSKTFADIKNYQVSMKASTISADTVSFTTPYFPQPIVGILSDRAFKSTREEDKIYPQFISHQKSLKIDNIKPNVNYEGGFSMKGAEFIGAGTQTTPSRITIMKAGKPFVVARASEIYITESRIFGREMQSTFYFHTGDSIFHPGLNFNYSLDKKIIEFSRPSTGIGQAPFQDSYHKLDFYVPKLELDEKGTLLTLTYDKGTSQEQRSARLESRDYFDARLYDQLQGLASTHPLVAIHNYCYKYDEYVLTEGKCATALGGTVDQVKPLMLQLANLGFISYDTDKKIVTVNQKLENFVKGRAGKRDYDNISFISDFRPKSLNNYTEEQIKNDPYLQSVDSIYKSQNRERGMLQEFGTINLTTLDMNLAGVDRVILSDKQNTMVFPDQAKIIVKKNRDFEFSGWVNAGKLEVNTVNASYGYDANKIYLIKTKESLFRVRPLKPEHGTSGVPMQSSITGMEGEILVDLPNNRSGNKVDTITATFPQVVVKNSTKVYYAYENLYRGAYDSMRFYYTIKPFTLDSLDNFQERFMQLDGELTSAGIFPVIKKPLKLMPDYSFGFSTVATAPGLDFYGTGAKYENKIILSNDGLQGAGKIDFVNSTSVSKELFTFLPDSTVGNVTFTNRPSESGVQFPDVTCEDAYMIYVPKQNILKAHSTPKNDFICFDKEAKLRGTTYVTPKGMRGSGLMNFVTASVVSDNFVYKRYEIDSDTSSFNLKNQYPEEGEDLNMVEAKNMNAHISFKERKGVFVSNNGMEEKVFPVNQYKVRMDRLTWFMDEEVIEMEKTDANDVAIESGVDLVGSNLFSIHPKQDNLSFRAPKARVSLKDKTIYCTEVEFVDIADARIYPDSMKINIRKNAKLDELKNARIVANYVTKYHTFEKADVEITARRAYKGTGEYPYYDRDSIPTYIQMDAIGLDTSYQTIASGKIGQDMNFKLSAEFDYYGTISVAAANPSILFNGATRINHNCDKFERNWLAFTSEIDPSNVQIPVSSTMKNLDGQAISAGIVWRDAGQLDSVKLYPTFLSALQSPNDPIVITASGFLSYSAEAKEFQISTKEKLINRNAVGNYISLHTESCAMYGDGIVNLGMDYGDLTVSTVGNVSYDQKTGETRMNLTAKFDMAVDKGLFRDVATRIAAVEGLNPMDFKTNTLKLAVAQWEGQAEADKMEEDFEIKGEIKKVPNSMETAIVVTGLRLSSFESTDGAVPNGLITNVESAILVNMFDKAVMKYVPLRAYFGQRYSGSVNGDKFGLLLDIPGFDYFFDYSMTKKEGTLDIFTGDTEFATGISTMKDDKRKTKNFLYRIGQGGGRTTFGLIFTK